MVNNIDTPHYNTMIQRPDGQSELPAIGKKNSPIISKKNSQNLEIVTRRLKNDVNVKEVQNNSPF